MGEFEEDLKRIRDSFENEDVLVSLRKPPALITLFLPEEENRDVIFVSKNFSGSDKLLGQIISHPIADTPVELEGNPLEAPFEDTINVSMNFKLGVEKGSESYHPVSILGARHCLSLCNTLINPKLPVWIFTDGQDDDGKVFLLSTHNRDNWNIRSYAVQNDCHEDQIPLEQLIKRHQKNSIIRTPPQIDRSKLSCTYNKVTNYHENGNLYSATLIKMFWDKLILNPPLNSNYLNIQVITRCWIGNGSDGLAFMWNELLLLNTVLEMIKNKDSSQFFEKTQPFTSVIQSLKSELTGEPQNYNLKQLLTPYVTFTDAKAIKTLSDILNSFLSVKRQNLDATDKLWHLFLTCTSIGEISQYVKQINELKQSHSFFISNGNISRIATVLSGEGSGDMIIDPLEYFVEVGLDKLRKEIFSIFSESGIASQFSLNIPKFPKFCKIAANNWVATAEGWIVWASQVYSALELLTNTQNALSLTNEIMAPHTTKLLEDITGPNSKVEGIQWILDNKYQELQWSIPPRFIQQHIETTPDIWTLILESSFKDCFRYKSIFKKTNQSQLPANISIDNCDFGNTSIFCKSDISICELSRVDVSMCNVSTIHWSEMHVLSNKLV